MEPIADDLQINNINDVGAPFIEDLAAFVCPPLFNYNPTNNSTEISSNSNDNASANNNSTNTTNNTNEPNDMNCIDLTNDFVLI